MELDLRKPQQYSPAEKKLILAKSFRPRYDH